MITSARTTPFVGQTAQLSRTVGDNDIVLFTEISGDRNPLHYDEAAAAFLRRYRQELTDSVSHAFGVHPYVVDHLLNEMILQSRRLGLRRCRSEAFTKRAAKILVTVQTRRFLRAGRHRLAL